MTVGESERSTRAVAWRHTTAHETSVRCLSRSLSLCSVLCCSIVSWRHRRVPARCSLLSLSLQIRLCFAPCAGVCVCALPLVCVLAACVLVRTVVSVVSARPPPPLLLCRAVCCACCAVSVAGETSREEEEPRRQQSRRTHAGDAHDDSAARSSHSADTHDDNATVEAPRATRDRRQDAAHSLAVSRQSPPVRFLLPCVVSTALR